MSNSQIELVKALVDDYCRSSWVSDPWRSASFSSLPDAVRAASITDSSYRLFSSFRFVQYLSTFAPNSSSSTSSPTSFPSTLSDDYPSSSSASDPTSASTSDETTFSRELGDQLYRMLEDPSHYCVDKVTDILLALFDRHELSYPTWGFDVFAQPQFSIYQASWVPFCLVLENALDHTADLGSCGRIIRRILLEVQSLLDFSSSARLTPDNPYLSHPDPSIPLAQAGVRVLVKLADLVPMYFWFTEVSRLFDVNTDEQQQQQQQQHQQSTASTSQQPHPSPQTHLAHSQQSSSSQSQTQATSSLVQGPAHVHFQAQLQAQAHATAHHKPVVLHWSLQELFDNIFGQRYRLGQFLRGIGTTECLGPEIPLPIQSRPKETDLHRIIQSGVPTLNGASRQNFINKLHLMLKLAMSGEMLEHEVAPCVTSRTQWSEELCVAMALRTRDLLLWTDQQLRRVPRPSIREIWIPWHLFSAQFYEVLKHQMIDLIAYLQLMIEMDRKESLRMDIVIWLVYNCSSATLPSLCTELAVGGDTISQIMFSCRTTDDPIGFKLVDMSRTLLFYRILAESDNSDPTLKQNLVKFFDPAWVDERQRKIYRESKQSFDNEQANFDFSNLTEQQEDLLLHIASYFPSLGAVVNKIQGWVKAQVPNRMPMPTSLLSRLTPIMREKILVVLLDDICTLPVVPFPLIETFARLCYFLPRERARIEIKLRKHVGSEDKKEQVVHALVELINYRLFRVWQARNACPNLLNILLACQLLRTPNPVYYENVVSLLWRIFLASSRLRLQSSAVVSCQLSIATSRIFLYGIARNLQTQDVQDAGHLCKLRPLLDELVKQSIRPPAPSQRVSFPAELDLLLPRTENWPRIERQQLDGFAAQEACPGLEDLGKDTALLPVVWMRKVNRRDGNNLRAVWSQFMPQRRADLSYHFADWLIDSPDPELRTELLIGLIAEYQLSTSSIVVALLDRADEDEHQHKVFQYLNAVVVKTMSGSNYEASTLGARREHWLDEGFHTRLSHMVTSATSPSPPMQFHYTLAPMRVLPLVDYMLCRCIELQFDGRQEAALFLQASFKPLFTHIYPFHCTPLGFVRDTLSYYSSRLSESRDIRFSVVSLLMHLFPVVFSPSPFSPQFTSFVNDPETLVLPSDYYSSLVEKVAVQLRHSDQPPTIAFDYRFREFPCSIDETRAQVVIELLSLPLSPNNTMIGLLWAALSQLSTDKTTFAPLDISVLNAVALIFAAMPQSFHGHLIDLCNSILISPQRGLSRATDITPLLQSMYGTDFETARATSLDTIPSLFLMIFQSVLHFGRIHILNLIPDMIFKPIFEETTTEYLSINRLFFLCKLISPFIYRVQLDLLVKFLGYFFAYLQRIDNYVEELATVVHPDKAAFALQLLDTVILFMFHCRRAFTGFSPEFLATVGGIIARFSPYLSRKFRFWC